MLVEMYHKIWKFIKLNFFETGSYHVALFGLELAKLTKMALISQRSICPCFPEY